MENFDAKAVCRKCGSTDITFAYHKTKHSCLYRDSTRPDVEHIHSTCKRCGWDWASAPIHED